VWYDHRADVASGILTDVYHAGWHIGAGAFLRYEEKVNDGPSINWNLITGRFVPNMGDYIALTSSGPNTYAHWADARAGSPDSWMAPIVRTPLQNPAAGIEPGAPGPGDLAGAGGGGDGGRIDDGVAAGTMRLGIKRGESAPASVRFDFDLPTPGRARLDLFAVTGERVRTLVDGAFPAGPQRLAWDGRADDGRLLESGVYFARLSSAGRGTSARVLLLR